MTEPVSLADIKVHLRLDPSETDEDDYLSALITGARRACEARIHRSIVGADLSLSLDAFPAYLAGGLMIQLPLEIWDRRQLIIELPGGTVSSVDSVTYLDAAGTQRTVDSSTYAVDLANAPARVAPLNIWPIAGPYPGAVTVAYAASVMDADDLTVVGQAIRLLIGGWYRNRESVQVDARGSPAEIPLAVTWLLEPLRQFATS